MIVSLPRSGCVKRPLDFPVSAYLYFLRIELWLWKTVVEGNNSSNKKNNITSSDDDNENEDSEVEDNKDDIGDNDSKLEYVTTEKVVALAQENTWSLHQSLWSNAFRHSSEVLHLKNVFNLDYVY